jgi:biotin-(acetyl-CoA carboxylase) ligase
MDFYLANLYWFGQVQRFKADEDVFEGTITGVEKNGQLIVSSAGAERLYNFKEIEFLNKHI